MNQSSTEPEFSVETSEKTSQQWDLGRISSQILLAQVVVKSRQSLREASMSLDTLEVTLDLLLELQQSLQGLSSKECQV